MITATQLRKAARVPTNSENMNSLLVSLSKYGHDLGLDLPHREVQFYAQIMHENGEFRYDREVWGPTEAQKRYDTRTDLGNTAARDGDGEKYKGRTGIQITGKANYAAFYQWCREQGFNPPDFVAYPDLVNTDPWEGLGPLWYWSTRNLNKAADAGDIETITKRINGGKNGLADRMELYTRLGLVVLGFEPTDVRGFQKSVGLEADGDAGPKTRSMIHKRLLALTPSSQVPDAKAAPVVEEKAVVPAAVETTVKKKFNFLGSIGGALSTGGVGFAALSGFNERQLMAIAGIAVFLFIGGLAARQWIIGALRDIKNSVEGA